MSKANLLRIQGLSWGIIPFMLNGMKPYEYYYLAKLNFLPNAEDKTRIKGTVRKNVKIHVSAVCGKAMASIACMLKELGYQVTGSDKEFFPPMSDVLQSHGIMCLPYAVENLEGVGLLVVGNTLAFNSLEVVEARKRNIPMCSGAEVMEDLFTDKRSLVVSGTHGKTTTSGLLTHLFLHAERNPAYMIGGVFQHSNESYSIGSRDSAHIIYEGDEYNSAFFDRGPKFLHYRATSVILTSIEHDHVDLYPTFPDYVQAFQFLIESIPADGFLVVHEEVMPLLDTSKCPGSVITYGASPSADVRYEITKVEGGYTFFDIHSEKIGRMEGLTIPLFGEYNVANATSAAALSFLEKLSVDEIKSGLSVFPGTQERQELLGKRGDITVIRDYAHHPTAIGLTLLGLRLGYPAHRFIAIFEPRSASSKRKVFEEAFGDSLSHADISIIIEPVIKNSDSHDCLDISNATKHITSFGRQAHAVKNTSEAFDLLQKIILPGDVLVFMSSGDMNGIPKKILLP